MPEPVPHSAGTSPAQDLTGTTVGRFRIRSRLGAGGMGEVYRAEDTRLKRLVALKRLAPKLSADPHYRQRFLKEAERASALSDKNIAGIYDVLELDGEIFLVMEYVEGTTLREQMQAPLASERFLPIALQCAEALVAAHEKNIVHRDIKPENIMRMPNGQVKILDFGVAKRLPRADESDATQTSDSTTLGGISGTPAYMAPEVLLEQEADGRADIFSLGVVFYEALSGRNPFIGVNFVATADHILHETPAPLRQVNAAVPEELERIVSRMLAKDPAERYASARGLVVDLQAVQALLATPRERGVGVAGRRPSAQPRAWPWPPTLGVRVAAAVVLAAIVLAAVPAVREQFRRWLLPVSVRANPYIAVMAFEVPGGDGETKAFADGLAHTLTATLTKLTLSHPLQVAPTNELARLRQPSVELAAKELGVNLVLTGSLQRWGNDLRITVNLEDPRARQVLRADIIDGNMQNPRELIDRVMGSAATMLELELSPKERETLALVGSEVPGAYELYLKGRGYLRNYAEPENIDRAIALFQRALDLDSRYALAHAGLGEAYWRKYEGTKDIPWAEKARQACEQSVALDAKLAAAYTCLGTIHNGTGEYEKAAAEFTRALESEPTNDDAYRGLGRAYERLGKPVDAEQTYRKAIELRPHYWAGYSWLAAFYFYQARYADAAKMFEEVVRLNPDSARGYRNLGAVYHRLGKPQEAITALEKSMALRPNADAASNLGTVYFYGKADYAGASKAFEQAVALNEKDYKLWGNLGAARHWAGDQAGARAAFSKAAELAETQRQLNPRDAQVLSDLADYYAQLGQKSKVEPLMRRALEVAPDDAEIMFRAAVVYEYHLGQREEALAWLAKAVRNNYSKYEIERSPSLQKLRADPRYKRLWQEK